MHRESILRNSIFLVFLFLELAYCLIINIYEIPFAFLNHQNTLISIAPNCTLNIWTFLGFAYNNRFGIIILNIISILGELSFAMISWFFGVSLFHLSFAARNELRVK